MHVIIIYSGVSLPPPYVYGRELLDETNFESSAKLILNGSSIV